MSEVSSLWWTDERIETTLCRQYVIYHLQPDYQTRLFELLPWGEGLTSESYLDWILTKAGKLFLILNDIGIANRIFDLADDCVDDSDLPFAEGHMSGLHLAPEGSSSATGLQNKFFIAQWRFLARGIAEGDHVKYTENEGVPVEVVKDGFVNVDSRRGVEKVVLSGAVCRVYLRTQIKTNAAPHFYEEEEVLEGVRLLRQLAHEHLFSIYGSYFADDSISVIFKGEYKQTLSLFLNDAPQSFKRLAKSERRDILVNWPHCLVNGLAWLHAQGHGHGGIRPSNVLVDHEFRTFLGPFEAMDTLLDWPKINDMEAYQYAAPERWIRTTAIQEVNTPKTSHHSGGRTIRKATSASKIQQQNQQQANSRESWMTGNTSPSVPSESKGTVIRVGSGESSTSHGSSSSSSGRPGRSGAGRGSYFRTKPILYTPSIISPNSSDTTTRPISSLRQASSIPFVPYNSTIVRTWQSQQSNTQLSDIFSLGAVITDIFTFLCERKQSAFANHRAAKNRTPGRGGGVADASFHLAPNLGQVSSWMSLLTRDSKKRKGLAFRAVEPMLEVVREMMARSPEKRPSAKFVQYELANTIQRLDRIITIHCPAMSYNSLPKPTQATLLLNALCC
jgi:serine/threonine protein kinase